MDGPALSLVVLLVSGAAAFVASLLARRLLPDAEGVDSGPWASTLGYVATAYGVVIGFSILFLFGQFSDARSAVGDEATSIGTAFEEARLFGDDAEAIQGALICYARAVSDDEWPALEQGRSSPEVDAAYTGIVLALGEADQPPDSAFGSAVATNLVAQVGAISTARETRLVAAETQLPVLFWGLLIGGALFVNLVIFVLTLPARPTVQALLVSLSVAFTAALLLIVLGLAHPFAGGAGRVTPELIQETTAGMVAESPAAAALPCPADTGG